MFLWPPSAPTLRTSSPLTRPPALGTWASATPSSCRASSRQRRAPPSWAPPPRPPPPTPQTVRRAGGSRHSLGKSRRCETPGASEYHSWSSFFYPMPKLTDRPVVPESCPIFAQSFNFPPDELVSLSSEHFGGANSFPMFRFISPLSPEPWWPWQGYAALVIPRAFINSDLHCSKF